MDKPYIVFSSLQVFIDSQRLYSYSNQFTKQRSHMIQTFNQHTRSNASSTSFCIPIITNHNVIPMTLLCIIATIYRDILYNTLKHIPTIIRYRNAFVHLRIIFYGRDSRLQVTVVITVTWWRFNMEMFTARMSLCVVIHRTPVDSLTKGPGIWSFNAFFICCTHNTLRNEQSSLRWFGRQLCLYNVIDVC